MSDWQEAEQRVERAHELYERGRWEEALSELRRAIEINPHNGAWYFNLGLTLDMMDRYDEALTAFEHAVRLDPQDIESLTAAGTDSTRVGKYQNAIEFFQRVEQIDSSVEACYCNRIAAYSELGDFDRAEEMFYLARQYREKCPLCFYNMGMALFNRGRYDRALWCWQQVLDLETDYPQVHARIADVFWAKGRLPEARIHLIEELRSDPGNLDTLLDLGELLMEMGLDVPAAEKFRQVLDLDPDDCTAHYQLGVLAQKEGDWRLALERYKFVLRQDRQFIGAHLQIALVHYRQKNHAEALYHANCELAQKELDDATLLELGNLFLDMSQYDSAQAAMRRLLDQTPHNADARHGLAVAMLMAHRIDEGIEQCKLALKIQPKHSSAMFNLALAYMAKHDYARSRYWLQEALDIAPDDAQLRQIQHRLWLESRWVQIRQWPRTVAKALGWGRNRGNPSGSGR